MCSCNQKLVTLAFLFERCPWFKFDNLGLALGMVLTFCISVTKELKLKAGAFSGLIPMLIEVTQVWCPPL